MVWVRKIASEMRKIASEVRKISATDFPLVRSIDTSVSRGYLASLSKVSHGTKLCIIIMNEEVEETTIEQQPATMARQEQQVQEHCQHATVLLLVDQDS